MPVELELVGIDKHYRGVHALRGADLRLLGGEVHALVGQNGAGKSTLVKVLTGAVAADAGQIRLDGREVSFTSPADAERTGIACVHQDSELFGNLSVADNIAITNAPARRIGPLRVRDRTRTRTQVAEQLDQLGIDIDPAQPAGRLGAAESKLIAVARALRAEPSVLVLDEPTASLEPREVRLLLGLLRRISASGTAVLFVSHKLAEVMELATRVTALRDGAVTVSVGTVQLDLDDLVRLVAGTDLVQVRKDVTAEGAALLAAERVESGSVGPVDLSMRKGEVIALTGLLGSGAGQFLRAVAGADARRGTVVLSGAPVRPGDRAAAAGQGLGYVPEDRRRGGIVAELSIERNIALASLGQVSRRGVLSRRRMRSQAVHFIGLLGIRPSNPALPAGNLSGGNQQKVLLARWLASDAKVLLLEEPTHGLDVGAKPEIYAHLRKFAMAGGAVALVSTEMGEVLELADRIGVFRDGKLAELLPHGTTEQEVTACAVGGQVGAS